MTRKPLAVALLALAWAVPARAASWSPPVSVYAGDAASVPSGTRVAIDNAGYGVAAFGEGVAPGQYTLRLAERVPGGAWHVSRMPVVTGDSAYRYDVAIDPAGNALAVWDVSTTVQTIEMSTWHPGAAGWSPAKVIATTSIANTPETDPGLEFSASTNASGQIVVGWESTDGVIGDGEDTTVYGMVGTPAGGFAKPVPVATLHDNDRAFFMSTAIGPRGAAAIQWTREYEGAHSSDAQSDIEVAVRPAGGGFPPDTPFEVTALLAPAYAQGGDVAVDGAGDVLSMYFGSLPSDPYAYHVESSYLPSGGSFGPPQEISPFNDVGNTSQIVAAFDARGNATAAWIELAPPANEPSGPIMLYSAARPAGASSPWGAATQVADPLANTAGGLSIAEAGDGSAILALDPAGAWDHSLLLSRAGSSAFGSPEELACVATAVAIAPNDDAVAGCSGAQDRSNQIVTRYAHTTAKGKVAVGLRSARIHHRRLVLHGTASGRGAVSITIRRRARRTAVEVIRVKLRGGAWTRSLTLPRDLSRGTYEVVVAGAHVHGARTSFHLAA